MKYENIICVNCVNSFCGYNMKDSVSVGLLQKWLKY